MYLSCGLVELEGVLLLLVLLDDAPTIILQIAQTALESALILVLEACLEVSCYLTVDAGIHVRTAVYDNGDDTNHEGEGVSVELGQLIGELVCRELPLLVHLKAYLWGDAELTVQTRLELLDIDAEWELVATVQCEEVVQLEVYGGFHSHLSIVAATLATGYLNFLLQLLVE